MAAEATWPLIVARALAAMAVRAVRPHTHADFHAADPLAVDAAFHVAAGVRVVVEAIADVMHVVVVLSADTVVLDAGADARLTRTTTMQPSSCSA